MSVDIKQPVNTSFSTKRSLSSAPCQNCRSNPIPIQETENGTISSRGKYFSHNMVKDEYCPSNKSSCLCRRKRKTRNGTTPNTNQSQFQRRLLLAIRDHSLPIQPALRAKTLLADSTPGLQYYSREQWLLVRGGNPPPPSVIVV